jgi:Holliday junction resolvase RusA-like endonuclease
MKKLTFTIKGNQLDTKGNPLPYLRTTQGSQWTDKAVKYQEWKMYVVAQFIDALDAMTREERMGYKEFVYIATGKPIIATKGKIYVNLKIEWKNDTSVRGDCDNIFKGIADALFVNDKYVAGSFDYETSKTNSGKVDVEIIWK